MAQILVVEDEPDFRELLGDYLEVMGHAVLRAATAAQALTLSSHTPEIALVDWSLPDARGDEVITALNKSAPNCRIVVMTGHGSAVTDALAPTLHILHKPFRLSAVAGLIKTLC